MKLSDQAQLADVFGALNERGIAPGDIIQAVLEMAYAADRMPCGAGEAGDRCRVTTVIEKTGEIEQMVLGPDADYVLTLGPGYELAHRQLYPGSGTTILTIKRRP